MLLLFLIFLLHLLSHLSRTASPKITANICAGTGSVCERTERGRLARCYLVSLASLQNEDQTQRRNWLSLHCCWQHGSQMVHLQSRRGHHWGSSLNLALAGTANLTLTSTEANEMPLSLQGVIVHIRANLPETEQRFKRSHHIISSGCYMKHGFKISRVSGCTTEAT